MPIPVFTETIWNTFAAVDVWPNVMRQDDGAFRLVVHLVAPLPYREYTLVMKKTSEERAAVSAFLLEARRLGVEPFFFKDPHPEEYLRTGVALTLVSGSTYSLPTAIDDPDYRFYPIDDADIQLYDNGAPVAHSAVDTDARTVTYTAPPAGVATIDYAGYRLCVLVGDRLDWRGENVRLFGASPVIREVLRP